MVTRLTGRDPTYGVSLSFISVRSAGLQQYRGHDSRSRTCCVKGTTSFGMTTSQCGPRRMAQHRWDHHRWTDSMLAAIGGISLLVGGIES